MKSNTNTFSFGSECVFLLATNVNKSFAVHTPRVKPNCNPAQRLDCVEVGFYVWEKKYTLTANGEFYYSVKSKMGMRTQIYS
jgi:hypothetical protein